MGRYVPPEYEGTTSANKLAGKHALGARANKLGQGILTVRFEMPFPIWCTSCPKPTIIGQGVRFNAEKKKVGNYYSTPIYSFRMKHVLCGAWIEIRTDPKNTAYIVTEGAKKRDTGEDKLQEGDVQIKTNEEREAIANNAFAALEEKVEDKRQASSDKSRIEELLKAKDRDWDDPGEANRRLRKSFRVDRKIRQKNEKLTENLKDRMSLGMDLLEETEQDRRRADVVEFGESGGHIAIEKAQSKPLFASSAVSKEPLSKRVKTTKAALIAEQRKESFRNELGNNTRAVLDPFLNDIRNKPSSVPIIKRKSSPLAAPKEIFNTTTRTTAPALVDYDSD